MRQTAIQLAEVLAQLVGALAGTAGGATFNHAEIARYGNNGSPPGQIAMRSPGSVACLPSRPLIPTWTTSFASLRTSWANELGGRLRRRQGT